MKKIFLLLFILLVLTSCSQSKYVSPKRFIGGTVPLTDAEVVQESNLQLYSGASYNQENIFSTLENVDGTNVVCPVLPTEELATALRTKISEHLNSLDLPFRPKLIDFYISEAFSMRTYVFYVSDSADMYNSKKLYFSYNTETLKLSSLDDYFTKERKKEVLYEICNNPNGEVEAILADSEGLYIVVDDEEFFVSTLYLMDTGVINVFHPEDYNPVVDTNEKYVALTFDDGPNPYTTPSLIKYLDEKGVKATFFVLGYNIEEYPYIIKKLHDSGHDIGIHSYGHKDFTGMDAEDILLDIDKCSNLVYSIISKKPYLVRPPYGAIDMSKIDTDDYFFVNWNVDPLDWKCDSHEQIAEDAIKYVKPGSIILLHDIYKSSCEAAKIIVDELLDKGYRFVTLSEYFDLNGKKPDNKLHFYLEDFNAK